MNSRLILRFVFFLLIISAVSCTLEKRKYFPGFYKSFPGKTVHANAKNNSAPENSFVTESPRKADSVFKNTDSSVVKNQTAPVPAKPAEKISHRNFQNKNSTKDSCDRIITTKGDTIRCKVFLVDIHEIKYKRCDNPDGPVYVVEKGNISKIIFANGTTENISDPKNAASQGFVDELSLSAFLFAVLGAIVVLLSFYFAVHYLVLLGIIGLILGIVLGIIALFRLKGMSEKGADRTLAILALIPGIVEGLVFGVFWYLIRHL